MNEQVNTVNFLFCHEDGETGIKTGRRLAGDVQLPRRAAARRARGVPDAVVPIAGPAAAAPPGVAEPGRRRRACPRASASATRTRIIEVVKKWESVGVDRINFLLNAAETVPQEQVLDSLRLFAKEVMPKFARTDAAAAVAGS